MHDELTKIDIQKMQAEIDERVARRAQLREMIRAAKVEAPIEAGTVILGDVYGTEVIATKSIQ